MTPEEKILEMLKESEQTRKPVKIQIGEEEAQLHVLSFDKMEGLGKKGGVFSFYFEED